MGKPGYKESGFGAVEALLVLVIIGLLGFTGWYVWHSQKSADKNLALTASGNPTFKKETKPTQAAATKQSDLYAGWHTYSNSQVTFKYPSDWAASMGRGQSRVADATSPAFASTAMTTSLNPGAQVTLYLQLSTDSTTIDCASTPCQVTAAVPLNNSQLPGDVLAVVNQTSANGTNFTEYVVTDSSTKVGDTSISAVKAGSGNVYVFGQPYYTPSGGGLTEAARVTDTTTLQSDSHFKDLVGVINSIKF